MHRYLRKIKDSLNELAETSSLLYIDLFKLAPLEFQELIRWLNFCLGSPNR